MKINLNNEAKITTAIESVEKLSRVRLADVEDVRDAVSDIEKRLGSLNVPKKYWVGMRFGIDPNAQTFPSCYKGRPESTGFVVERFVSGWFITSIRRWSTGTRSIEFLNQESFRQFYQF